MNYEELMNVVVNDKKNVNETLFLAYVYMRQKAWYATQYIAQDNDAYSPILQNFRFPNVYRELDYTTRYVIENILEQHTCLQDVYPLVCLFRIFNNVPTFEAITTAIGGKELLLKRLQIDPKVGQDINAFIDENINIKIDLGVGSTQNTIVKFKSNIEHLVANLAFNSPVHAEYRGPYPLVQGLANRSVMSFMSAWNAVMDLSIPVVANKCRPWLGGNIIDTQHTFIDGNVKKACEIIRPDMPAGTCIYYLRQNMFMMLNTRLMVTDFKHAHDHNGSPVPINMANMAHALWGFRKWYNLTMNGRDTHVRLLSKPINNYELYTPGFIIPPGWK